MSGVITGTVEAVEADSLVHAPMIGNPNIFVPTGIQVKVRTTAGSFDIAWIGEQPKVGDRVTIQVGTTP